MFITCFSFGGIFALVEDIIVTEKLAKVFNETIKAVDQVDMRIRKGEIFGFLGPNGAGKTTTINMLTTLIKPTSGKAIVSGFDVVKNPDEVRRRIGIVFQDSVLEDRYTGYENMILHARLWGVKKEVASERIKELLELVRLTSRAKDLVRAYSGGMRRRLEIARGLVTRPEILFLDEPTLGLDPTTRRHIWEYIKLINREQGVTVFLTTHYLDEAEHLCERLSIIDYGKIVTTGSPSELINGLGGDVVEIIGEGDVGLAVSAFKPESYVKNVIVRQDNGLELTIAESEKSLPKIIRKLQETGYNALSIRLKKPSLDDVFIACTGRGLRDEEASDFEGVKKHFVMKKLSRR